MHSRIRIVGGICFGVVAVMCTAIPLLLAQDRSRPFSAATLAAIARVEAEIDRIEADALGRVRSVPDNQVQQIELLGKLMLFDKELSVNRNEACAFCHTPETGFTGPVSELNRTTGSYPGSVRTRFSERKPQTHTRRLLGYRPIRSLRASISDLPVASPGEARSCTITTRTRRSCRSPAVGVAPGTRDRNMSSWTSDRATSFRFRRA